MQPRKLLRRTSPKVGKKRALLANNVTREFGLFFHNSAGLVDISVLRGLTERTPTPTVGEYKNIADFFNQVFSNA